ncbi:hypothetical protein Taro_047840 [Colocasia esculenta]|uniref:Methyltransferase n=1 Tax=Colocasia esculenta TaxID=4460 RepID=A0A843X1L9_COLES|nr:hypothetical protein [Colocasia esculenta]
MGRSPHCHRHCAAPEKPTPSPSPPHCTAFVACRCDAMPSPSPSPLCNITGIVLEMDRILRPGGRAYIRDSVTVIYLVKETAEAVGWKADLGETEEGPYASRRLLRCDKPMSHR